MNDPCMIINDLYMITYVTENYIIVRRLKSYKIFYTLSFLCAPIKYSLRSYIPNLLNFTFIFICIPIHFC